MFPLRHCLWIILALLAAIVFSYWFLDQSIAIFFHTTPFFLVSLCHFINAITGPAPNVLLWPLLFYFVYFLMKKESMGTKILLIALSVNAVNALTTLMKIIFGRYRPKLWFSQNLYGFDFFSLQNQELSFPSGHAVTICAVMVSLSCFYPKRFISFLLIGFILSLARVVVESHYLSDILASVLIGFIIPQFIYISMKKSRLYRK